jgi:hypothetical protein
MGRHASDGFTDGRFRFAENFCGVGNSGFESVAIPSSQTNK